MKCSACGKDNADGNWVCGSCGEALSTAPGVAYDNGYYDSEPSQAATGSKQSGNSSTIVKLIASALIAILAGILIWNFFIKGEDTSTPSGTMEAYIKAVSNDDCETLYDLTPEDMVPANRDQAESSCSQLMGLLNVDFTNYRTTGETVDGDTATVDYEVTVEAMGQSMPIDMSAQLVKEGSKWKVQPQ